MATYDALDLTYRKSIQLKAIAQELRVAVGSTLLDNMLAKKNSIEHLTQVLATDDRSELLPQILELAGEDKSKIARVKELFRATTLVNTATTLEDLDLPEYIARGGRSGTNRDALKRARQLLEDHPDADPRAILRAAHRTQGEEIRAAITQRGSLKGELDSIEERIARATDPERYADGGLSPRARGIDVARGNVTKPYEIEMLHTEADLRQVLEQNPLTAKSQILKDLQGNAAFDYNTLKSVITKVRSEILSQPLPDIKPVITSTYRVGESVKAGGQKPLPGREPIWLHRPGSKTLPVKTMPEAEQPIRVSGFTIDNIEDIERVEQQIADITSERSFIGGYNSPFALNLDKLSANERSYFRDTLDRLYGVRETLEGNEAGIRWMRGVMGGNIIDEQVYGVLPVDIRSIFTGTEEEALHTAFFAKSNFQLNQEAGAGATAAENIRGSAGKPRIEGLRSLVAQLREGGDLSKKTMTIWDTETPGLASDEGFWSISARHIDETGKVTNKTWYLKNNRMRYGTIMQQGKEISYEDFVHGRITELEGKVGKVKVHEVEETASIIRSMIEDFFDKSDLIVGHNQDFDLKQLINAARQTPEYQGRIDPSFVELVDRFERDLFARPKRLIDSRDMFSMLWGNLSSKKAPKIAAELTTVVNQTFTPNSISNILLQTDILEKMIQAGGKWKETAEKIITGQGLHLSEIDTAVTHFLLEREWGAANAIRSAASSGNLSFENMEALIVEHLNPEEMDEERLARALGIGVGDFRENIAASAAMVPSANLSPDQVSAAVRRAIGKDENVTAFEHMMISARLRHEEMGLNTPLTADALIQDHFNIEQPFVERGMLSEGFRPMLGKMFAPGEYDELFRTMQGRVAFPHLSPMEQQVTGILGRSLSNSRSINEQLVREAWGGNLGIINWQATKEVHIANGGYVRMPMEMIRKSPLGQLIKEDAGALLHLDPFSYTKEDGIKYTDISLSYLWESDKQRDDFLQWLKNASLDDLGLDDKTRAEVMDAIQNGKAKDRGIQVAVRGRHTGVQTDNAYEAIVHAQGGQEATGSDRISRLATILTGYNEEERTIETAGFIGSKGLGSRVPEYMRDQAQTASKVYRELTQRMTQDETIMERAKRIAAQKVGTARKAAIADATVKTANQKTRFGGLFANNLTDEEIFEKVSYWAAKGKEKGPVGLLAAAVVIGAYYIHKRHKTNLKFDATLNQMPYEDERTVPPELSPLGMMSSPRRNPLATANIVGNLNDGRIGHTQMGASKNNHLFQA